MNRALTIFTATASIASILSGCNNVATASSRLANTKGVRVMLVDAKARTAFDLKHNPLPFPRDFEQDHYAMTASRSIGASLYDDDLSLVAKVGGVMIENPISHIIKADDGTTQRVCQIPLPLLNDKTYAPVKLWATEGGWNNWWKGVVGKDNSNSKWQKRSDGTWDVLIDIELPKNRSLLPLMRLKFDGNTTSEIVIPRIVSNNQIRLRLELQLKAGQSINIETMAAKLVFDEQIEDDHIAPKPVKNAENRPRVELLGILPCYLSGSTWTPRKRGWSSGGAYEAMAGSNMYTGFGTSRKCDMVYLDFRIRDLPAHASVGVAPVGKRFGFGQISNLHPSLDGEGRIYSVMVDRLTLPKLFDVEVRIGEGDWTLLQTVTEPYTGPYPKQPAGTLGRYVYPAPASLESISAKIFGAPVPRDLTGTFFDSLGREVEAPARMTMADGIGMQRQVSKLNLPVTRAEVYQRPLKTFVLKSISLWEPAIAK